MNVISLVLCFFAQAAARAQEYYQFIHHAEHKENKYLFVRSEYSLVKIAFDDIHYIETLDDYIKIHVGGRKPILTKMNLKAVSEKLPADFVRVHRSFIVPLARVQSVRGKNIRLQDIEIPLGVTYEEEFFKKYKA